jgi:formiminoglutamase
MNFSMLFDPIEGDLFQNKLPKNAWGNSISIHKNRLPAWKRKHLAIIGIPEERGALQKQESGKGIALIRRKLYQLQKGNGIYQIVDLGNLRLGMSLEDTLQRIALVCENLLEHHVLPILIGGSQDLNIGQWNAYQNHPKLINFLNVDATVDMQDETSATPTHHNHLHYILHQKEHNIFNYSHLGYQTYFNSPDILYQLQKWHYDIYNVGKMREDFNEIEPVVRNADLMSFDISAIKMNDAPGNNQAPILGLTAEEACQICWFAGLSEKLSSVGFYEYCPELDVREKTASLIALMIWYFVEGFYNRVKLNSFNSNAFIQYVVSKLDNSGTMTFYKHKVSQKWWLEVPYPNNVSINQEKMIIPCSYKDYHKALNESEVPDRWINTYSKLG